MSKENEILRLLQDGYSQRHIASTLRVSRNAVAKIAKAASGQGLSKDTLESMEEAEIHRILFPEEAMLPALVTPPDRPKTRFLGIKSAPFFHLVSLKTE